MAIGRATKYTNADGKWSIAMRKATFTALLMIGSTTASIPGEVFACVQPVAVERGKGAQQSATQAANVGVYEWSTGQQAYVMTNAWYDASLLYLPLQSHEIDVTDEMPTQPLASSTKDGERRADPSGLCKEAELPTVTVVAVPPSPGRRMTGFMLRRYAANQPASGSWRWAITPQLEEAETRIDTRACSEQNPNGELEACAAITSALGAPPPANQYWIITYSDGRRMNWKTVLVGGMCAESTSGCY